jgi:hypothetical protein
LSIRAAEDKLPELGLTAITSALIFAGSLIFAVFDWESELQGVINMLFLLVENRTRQSSKHPVADCSNCFFDLSLAKRRGAPEDDLRMANDSVS